MVEPTDVTRKLAVILVADAVGYTRLMREAEERTLQTLTEYRTIIDGLIGRHDGRVFGTAGDSVLAEFGSAVEAVRCALSIQEELAVRNAELSDDRKLRFRVGINVGDVMVKGDDLFGDAVNVAARLEGLAEPGGICVSASVFEQVKHKLSLSFEDIGPQAVKNVAEPVPAFRIVPGSVSVTEAAKPTPKPGVAARWRIPAFAAVGVVVVAVGGVALWQTVFRPALPPQVTAPEKTPALPDRPSIAVLAFDNMSDDPKQEYFSDGITEDIITDLSKISGLFVVARNSAFTYKGKAVKVEQIARELGVRYVLEGSVRKVGNKVRITAQLIDATTGGHLWAERYDRDLKDIFALQDEIAGKIAAALEVKLAAGEQEQVARRYTDNLEAYDLFLRGKEYQLRGTKGYPQARRMFEKAIELDPKFAAAYAELSYTHWEFQKRKGLERSFKAAQRAVALDDTLPLARSRLAWAYLRKRQREDAIREAKRAIALDPNFAEGYAVLAEILNAADRPEEGIRLIRKAMRLNPFPPAKYLFVLGQSYYMMGQNQKAIATLERARNRSPDDKPPHMHLIILYGETGQMEKARAETEEILRLLPNESIELEEQICTYAPGPLKRFLEGLRKAGFPEKSKSAAL